MRRLSLIISLVHLVYLAGSLAFGAPAPVKLKLIAPANYLEGIPVLVRIEALNSSGDRDWSLWQAEAVLSTAPAGVILSTNRVQLFNGLGSVFITIDGTGDFTLTATLGTLQAGKTIHSLGLVSTPVSGTLPGTATTWSGLIQVTGDVTIPAGHVLTIESNTVVLIDGVGSGTAAPDIFVNGTLNSLGTEEHPVTITCSSPILRFGQIRHTNAQASLYRYTSISRGGRSTGVGHTSGFGGPLIRLSNSRVTFESCNLTDNAGKIMHAVGSDLLFNNCLMARAIMGPEIEGTALLCTNTYIMQVSSQDDGDGIYVHSAGARQLKLAHCVIAGLTGTADDGVDTLSADVTIEDCIIRDWFHVNPAEDPKGISAFGNEVRVRGCLIVDNFIGINAKSYAPPGFSRVLIENCTITGQSNAVVAGIKGNAPGPIIDIRITNSILQSFDAVRSDFDPIGLTNFSIGYCTMPEVVPGTEISTADPLFADAAGHDFRLQPFSPCIDTGSPASPADPDGSPADRGCIRFLAPAPSLLNPQMQANGAYQFLLTAYTNRNYVIDVSSDAMTWSPLKTVSQDAPTTFVTDPTASSATHRFYRAHLAP